MENQTLSSIEFKRLKALGSLQLPCFRGKRSRDGQEVDREANMVLEKDVSVDSAILVLFLCSLKIPVQNERHQEFLRILPVYRASL